MAAALLAAVVLGVTALYAAQPIFSVDTFWHLTLGRVIDETGRVPTTDLFSAAHPERPWVQFQWLWEWLAFRLVDAHGLVALRLAQSALMLATLAGLFVFARRRGVSSWLSVAFVAAAFLLYADRLRSRPDTPNLAFLALLLPLLVAEAGRGLGRRTAAALGLAALWSNVHGGASLLVPGSLLAVAVGAHVGARLGFRDGEGSARGRAWLPVAAALLGVVLSPATVPGLVHFAAIWAPMREAGNAEWASTYTLWRDAVHPWHYLVAASPTLVAVAYAVREGRRVRREGRRAVALGTWSVVAAHLFLAHHAVRNVYLVLLPLLLLFEGWSVAEARSPGRRAIASAALAVALTVGVVHAGLVRGLGGVTAMSDVLGEDLAPGAQPAEAGAFLRETGLEGATVNFRRWSGYLLWSAWPKIHVLYDPRVNLTPEVWRLEGAAHDLRTRPAALAEAHGRYGVELAIFGAPAFVDAPPAGDGPWELVFKAGPEEIYQHREGAHAEENRRRIATWLAAHGGDARRGGAAGARSLGERVWAVAGARWRAATWQRRRAREAAALVEDPRASDPARAAAHRALGRLAYGARDLTSARRELTESLALLPTDAATAYELGLVELADGHGDAARPWLVRAGRAARLRPDALPPEDLRRLELLGERWRGDPRAPRGR